MKCNYCSSICIKMGRQSNGKQKYKCKSCFKYQQESYKYQGCVHANKSLFIKCLKNNCGLNDTRRITGISVQTQLNWIRKLGRCLQPPTTFVSGDTYEVDELCTYVGHKGIRRWIVLAMSRKTGKIVDITVGRRTKKKLELVINKLLMINPKHIYTDGLKEYKTLIPTKLHMTTKRGTNHIERFNLTVRTHIKRLNRRTIGYSKNESILEYILRIYLWSPH